MGKSRNYLFGDGVTFDIFKDENLFWLECGHRASTQFRLLEFRIGLYLKVLEAIGVVMNINVCFEESYFLLQSILNVKIFFTEQPKENIPSIRHECFLKGQLCEPFRRVNDRRSTLLHFREIWK